NLQSEDAVCRAYGQIEQSVTAKAGREHFQGVTVQPMVRQSGYELILGSSIDAQFGPVMLFGSGGRLVEVYQDRALALPPLTSTLVRRMMEQTKIYKALQGVRGRRAVDVGALESLRVTFHPARSRAEMDQRNRHQSAACIRRGPGRTRCTSCVTSAGN